MIHIKLTNCHNAFQILGLIRRNSIIIEVIRYAEKYFFTFYMTNEIWNKRFSIIESASIYLTSKLIKFKIIFCKDLIINLVRLLILFFLWAKKLALRRKYLDVYFTFNMLKNNVDYSLKILYHYNLIWLVGVLSIIV